MTLAVCYSVTYVDGKIKQVLPVVTSVLVPDRQLKSLSSVLRNVSKKGLGWGVLAQCATLECLGRGKWTPRNPTGLWPRLSCWVVPESACSGEAVPPL